MDSISETSLKRLPRYLQFLRRYQNTNKEYVSATLMGEFLGIHHTQVRKDLQGIGTTGYPKVGHKVDEAIRMIEDFLGWHDLTKAFLIGVGNLGSALIGYDGLLKSGIDIMAAFDVDKRKVGKKIRGVEIFHIDSFKVLAKRMHVNIVILATPYKAAQEIKQSVIDSGVSAVWNFIPATLDFPEEIIVENADIFSSLAVLSRKLKEKN